MAAYGCMRALSTVLDSVSSMPALFPQLEAILFPVMQVPALSCPVSLLPASRTAHADSPSLQLACLGSNYQDKLLVASHGAPEAVKPRLCGFSNGIG